MSTSVFEIIGPIMVGPSSSHTAGMARIGMMAHQIIAEAPTAIHLNLSPKMRNTYHGHRSDAALFGGTIGYQEADPRLRDAIELAHMQGIETSVGFLEEGKYPQNTARISVTTKSGEYYSVTGTSVGGGSILILAVDDAPITLTADMFHLVIWSLEPIPAELLSGALRIQSGDSTHGFVTCASFLREPDDGTQEAVRQLSSVTRFRLVIPVLSYGASQPGHPTYRSCEEACNAAKKDGVPLSEIAIRYEMGRSGFSRESVVARMQSHLDQMKQSLAMGQQENTLLYGLVSNKNSHRLASAVSAGKTISGGIVPEAVAAALGIMEYNGSMGCLVAAPTAGSSGIVPGTLLTVQKHFHFSDEQLVNALFVSSLIGVIMAERNVSFSGSVGGCQGEVGVSSAITAAGLASLFSGDPDTVIHAMALCLKNLLGLVCDPIAGPIEVPCIKRNAVGVANAFISADMAVAGIHSFIPPDEVIDALVDVENRLPSELKCATVGGLACTCTAKRIREQLASDM